MLIKIVPDEQVGEIIRSAGSQAALHILQPCIMNRAREGKTTSSSAELASSLFKELGGIPFHRTDALGSLACSYHYV